METGRCCAYLPVFCLPFSASYAPFSTTHHKSRDKSLLPCYTVCKKTQKKEGSHEIHAGTGI